MNKEERREYNRKYHKEKRGKEAQKVYYKDWYKKNSYEKRKQRRAYYKANRVVEKEKSRVQKFKRYYGLSLEDIDKILIEQQYKCKLCGASLIETKRCIDHDHKTGKVRGILCQCCNTGLGMFHDDPKQLSLAIRYIVTEGNI